MTPGNNSEQGDGSERPGSGREHRSADWEGRDGGKSSLELTGSHVS